MKQLLFAVVIIISTMLCEATAAPARKKVSAPAADPNEQIELAQTAFTQYRFDDAAAALEKYEQLRSRLKKPGEPIDYSDLQRRVQLGQAMLTRVEDIQIIDSVTVDSANFFRQINLAPTSGKILGASSIPQSLSPDRYSTVYRTERGDRLIWGVADPNSDSAHTLVSTSLLADGSWESPLPLTIDMPDGFNPAFPFLMADGVTLYFSSTGPESLGGFDIFISRDNGNGFLQPQNVGMPYNSTANDYLLAIDETTGAGFWVSDRNCPPGKVTIYTFIPEELRKNLAYDTPNLTDRAKVTSIADSQRAGANYSLLLNKIADNVRTATSSVDKSQPSLRFAMPDGRIITSLGQLRNSDARIALNDYIEACKELQSVNDSLAQLRLRYRSGDTSVEQEILSTELIVEQIRASIPRIANSVITLELDQ